jgi:hypothetical protein
MRLKNSILANITHAAAAILATTIPVTGFADDTSALLSILERKGILLGMRSPVLRRSWQKRRPVRPNSG